MPGSRCYSQMARCGRSREGETCSTSPWMHNDGAEACEQVGLYILEKLTAHLSRQSVGLYRDNGLAVLKDASGPMADRTRKQVTEVFKACGLKITTGSNTSTVNYLDITMCLRSGTFKPYRKPNDMVQPSIQCERENKHRRTVSRADIETFPPMDPD
eukprot:scpid95172/ scgid25362/ 